MSESLDLRDKCGGFGEVLPRKENRVFLDLM